MGWEKARRGKVPFFTQSQRIGGKVKRTYIGSGELGEAASALRESARYKRILDLQELSILYQKQEVVDVVINAYEAELERTFMAIMTQSGYHRHHRGEWRRKRQAKMIQSPSSMVMATHGQRLDLLRERAQSALLSQIFADDQNLQDEALLQMQQMRLTLAGEEPTLLERILVERIVLCWLQVHHYEMLHPQQIQKTNIAKDDFHLKRIESTHRRYLAAVKTLALLRRLQGAREGGLKVRGRA